MNLCQNQKIFSVVFSVFPESTKNLEYFHQKASLQWFFLREIKDGKKQSQLNAQKGPCRNIYGQSTC